MGIGVLTRNPFPFTSSFHSLQVNFFQQFTWIFQLQSLFYCPHKSQQGQGLTKYSYLGVFLFFFNFHSSFKIFDFRIYISKAIFRFLVLEFGKISLQIHFILAFLAGIIISLAIYMYILKNLLHKSKKDLHN